MQRIRSRLQWRLYNASLLQVFAGHMAEAPAEALFPLFEALSRRLVPPHTSLDYCIYRELVFQSLAHVLRVCSPSDRPAIWNVACRTLEPLEIRGVAVESRAHNQSLVARARESLVRNPDRRWSLESLAKSVGTDPRRLRYAFQKTERLSPIRYLMELRLERAKELEAQGCKLEAIPALTGLSRATLFRLLR
jgi:AraC-like DNA-binding protein